MSPIRGVRVRKLAEAPKEDRKRFEELRRQPAIKLVDEGAVKPSSKEGAATTNRWIADQLNWLAQNRIPPTEELAKLVAQQLGVIGQPRSSARDLKKKAAVLWDFAWNPHMSNVRLAKHHHVSKPTIARWKERAPIPEILALFEEYPQLINDNDIDFLLNWLDQAEKHAAAQIPDPARIALALTVLTKGRLPKPLKEPAISTGQSKYQP